MDDKITIARWQSNNGSVGISIRIEHDGKTLYEGDMTVENYGNLVSGKGNVAIDRDQYCMASVWLDRDEWGDC